MKSIWEEKSSLVSLTCAGCGAVIDINQSHRTAMLTRELRVSNPALPGLETKPIASFGSLLGKEMWSQ